LHCSEDADLDSHTHRVLALILSLVTRGIYQQSTLRISSQSGVVNVVRKRLLQIECILLKVDQRRTSLGYGFPGPALSRSTHKKLLLTCYKKEDRCTALDLLCPSSICEFVYYQPSMHQLLLIFSLGMGNLIPVRPYGKEFVEQRRSVDPYFTPKLVVGYQDLQSDAARRLLLRLHETPQQYHHVFMRSVNACTNNSYLSGLTCLIDTL
jgi:hypothetical protein